MQFGKMAKLRKVKRATELWIIRKDLYPEFWLRRRCRKELSDWESRGKLPPLPNVLKQAIVLEHGREFGLRTLVETGTLFGAMVDACKDAFARIYSIELQDAFYRRAQKRFARFPHVTLLHGDSGTMLAVVLGQICEPCLFWLDAHYMGGITAKGLSECPALRELELISSHPVHGHVVLMDDARFFLGTVGWPSLAAVEQFATSHGWGCDVSDDIIRLT